MGICRRIIYTGRIACISTFLILGMGTIAFASANNKRGETHPVSAHYGEWKDWNPKESYSNALPATALLGNGDVGVTSAGDKREKTYLVSKSDFWSAGNLKGVFSGEKDSKTKPLPIGSITIRPITPHEKEDKELSFYEKIDLSRAVLETKLDVQGKSLSLDSRVIATSNYIIIRLHADTPMNVKVYNLAKSDNANFPAEQHVEKDIIFSSRKTKNEAADNPGSWTSIAVLGTKIITGDSNSVQLKKETAEDKSPCFEVSLKPGKPAWVVTAAGGGGRTLSHQGALQTQPPLQEAQALLDRLSDAKYLESLLKDHSDWWENYWDASFVQFDKDDEKLQLIEQYYYGAQYIIGSAARPGKNAPGLFGIWQTTDDPNWSSDYHLNYNFISSFYGVASSNRCDLLLPPIQTILDYEEEGARRAASVAELERINKTYVQNRPDLKNGIPQAVLYPVGIGPWGSTTDDGYWNEALNAGYSSFPIMQYYKYTLDQEHLKNVYAFLKKCAAFYSHWLETEGDKKILYAGYNEGSWSKNPAVELATVKNILSFLVEASVALETDEKLRAQWKTTLTRLSPQPQAQWKGKTVYALAEKEWKDGKWQTLENPIPGDGNIIPLDIIIPGSILGYYSPANEQEIARNTIEVFGEKAWGQINNFPRIFYDAVQSRSKPEKILDAMHGVLKKQMGANLLVRDGLHGIEKAGATAALNSMLVLRDKGIIKILPCWPAGKNVKFRQLRVPGGFLVSATYEKEGKKISDLRIKSTLGGTVTMELPWQKTSLEIQDSRGNVIRPKYNSLVNGWEGETVSFPTEAGGEYFFLHK